MRVGLFFTAIFICTIGGSVTFVHASSSVCNAAKEQAWKAKEIVIERQQAVHLAQGATRFAYSQLVECRPGAIFTAGRARRCAHAQSEVPLKVQDQLDAEDGMYTALADYHKRLEWIGLECTPHESIVDPKQLLGRISSLEEKVKVLKALIE